MGLDADNEAIQQLCYSYENNLLALKQALQLLDLLYPDHKLNYNRVISVVEQSSIFTPFQWIDALLVGKANRAKRILKVYKLKMCNLLFYYAHYSENYLRCLNSQNHSNVL